MELEDRKRIQDLLRQLIILREDLHELEKTFSRLNNESIELYSKLSNLLDEG